MRLDIYVHDVREECREDKILSVLKSIQSQLTTIQEKEEQELAEIDDLVAAVAAEKTVEDSTITLLTNLTDKINGLVQNATDLAALKTAITGVTASVASDTQALSDAVTANTPAAPAP